MSTTNAHRSMYKKFGQDHVELRRQREEEGIQLRKQKRDTELCKRRNINISDSTDDASTEGQNFAGFQDKPPLITQDMIKSIYDDDVEVQLSATQRFRKILSKEPAPPIAEVIQTGIIPRLVQLLRSDNTDLQFEAAWALTNVASGTSEQTQMIVEAGAVPILVELMSSPEKEVQDQSVWALGNIAGDCPTFRDLVLAHGAMERLLKLLESSSRLSTTRNAVWTLSNFCRGKRPPPNFDQVSPCLPMLAKLLFHCDSDVLADACFATSYLSDGPNNRIQAVIDAGLVRRLVELLEHSNAGVASAALRAIGNIVTGDDLQTQHVLNCNVLPCLASLLTKEATRKEACWTISNITAGNTQQVQAVIDANIMPTLMGILDKAEFKTRKEAAWALSNAVISGSLEQVEYLVKIGCIPQFCRLFDCSDQRVVQIALNAIEEILKAGKTLEFYDPNSVNEYALRVEECGGLDSLEVLQSHSNNEIYSKSVDIIEKYFGTDDSGDANAQVSGQQHQMQAPTVPEQASNVQF